MIRSSNLLLHVIVQGVFLFPAAASVLWATDWESPSGGVHVALTCVVVASWVGGMCAGRGDGEAQQHPGHPCQCDRGPAHSHAAADGGVQCAVAGHRCAERCSAARDCPAARTCGGGARQHMMFFLLPFPCWVLPEVVALKSMPKWGAVGRTVLFADSLSSACTAGIFLVRCGHSVS